MIRTSTPPAAFSWPGIFLLALAFHLGDAFPALRADPPFISEFLASNSTGLRDEDGTYADWVEIHNPNDLAIDLNGWYLTDNSSNRTKWRFPPAPIPPRGYLVVFASNKDRREPGRPLHTNFALSASGEYLGLIMPDGVTVVHAFAPRFPPQETDVSYGYPSKLSRVTVVPEDAACRWMVPTGPANPGDVWRSESFDDSAWALATLGIGYDRNTAGVNFLPEIGPGGNTESAMYGINQTCFVRVPFDWDGSAAAHTLTLRVKYDDGLVAWLNESPLLSGAEQVSRNAPAALAWNSGATRTNDDAAAMRFEDIDISASIPSLRAGRNWLAFQVLNRGTTSSDLLFRFEVVAEVELQDTGPPVPGYFSQPTPGMRNGGPDSMVIPQAIQFSRPPGVFGASFDLSLSGATANQEIRFTTDRTIPSRNSPLYTGPVFISATTLVRARLFDPVSGASGPIQSAHYERMESDLRHYFGTGQPFRSALPIVVLNNHGGGEIPNDNTYRESRLLLLDRDESGYATLSADPALSSNVGVKLRGSSSAGFPKKSYSLELWDESRQERSQTVLGMPAESDWALISCYSFDRAFMRNALAYEMGRRTGTWAPRTRFVEVFFNQNGNDLGYGDYLGVYILVETVRRGGDRADITRLTPADRTLPELSGGYVFKVDRRDGDEFSWRTTRGLPLAGTGGAGLVIHRPKIPDLAAAQSAYLVDYFQRFEDALFSDRAAGFATRNYRRFIDTDTWVDHNLINAFAKNVDALRLSAYFLKDRGRRIEGGPLWDFDRSMDSTDGRDNAFNTWNGTGDATNYFTFAWWQQLFEDVEFRQRFVDRWQQLRREALSTPAISAVLDQFLAEFRHTDADHPARRDYARWYGSPTSNNIQNEVNHLRNWMTNRAAWIDAQFCPEPGLSRSSSPIVPGETVTLTVPAGTVVYYTLDGRDPRSEGGSPAPEAIQTSSSLTLPLWQTTHLVARSWRTGSFSVPATAWSAPVEVLLRVDEALGSASNLRVSALNYHPLAADASELAALPESDPSDFEWIELTNAGSGRVNLAGSSFARGNPVSELVLPPFTLAPGERAVVVKNREAFVRRYPGSASRVVAEWRRDKRLDNGGEEVHLRGPEGDTIARFTYGVRQGWPTRAAGWGSALEWAGPTQPGADYQNPTHWRDSRAVHGSPGIGPAEPPGGGLRLNEVYARPLPGEVAAVELVNLGPTAVDLGGWYLSGAASVQSADDFRRYRFPARSLSPGEFLALTEEHFNPNGSWNPAAGPPAESEFDLDGVRGGNLWLVSAEEPGSRLRFFEDAVRFTGVLPGVSQGRWPDGVGDIHPLAAPSLLEPSSPGFPPGGAGGRNSPPRAGVVQFSEIMYHPAAGRQEYVEIRHHGTETVLLSGWALRGNVEFFFGPHHALPPDGLAVIVPFDPVLQPGVASTFRQHYGLGAGVPLWGPWSAGTSLPDDGGWLGLYRALPVPPGVPAGVYWMLEDSVAYASAPPWPTGASGSGLSIWRFDGTRWGSDPMAWGESSPSPGSEPSGYESWVEAFFLAGEPNSGPWDDFDGDGLPNQLEYLLGTNPRAADSSPFLFELEREGGVPFLTLEFRQRRDRRDLSLRAYQSHDLRNWFPAEDLELIAVEGVSDVYRARLPILPEGSFLKLVVTGVED